jgi:hypothetical protein
MCPATFNSFFQKPRSTVRWLREVTAGSATRWGISLYMAAIFACGQADGKRIIRRARLAAARPRD